MGADGSKLAPNDLADMMRMTNFTDTELNAWYKAFKQETTTRFLTKDEFIRVFDKHFPNADAEVFADHVFRTFDVNNDGRLNFREFVIGLSLSTKGDFDEKLYWAFRLYDVDGNGQISKNEMKGVVSAIYAVCRERGFGEEVFDDSAKAFYDLDKDKDGQVSWAEFRNGIKANKNLMTYIGQSLIKSTS